MDKDYLEELLMDLDTEIGSTITYADNKEKVLSNMSNANKILDKIKEVFKIEF